MSQELVAQQLHWDVKALVATFAPLLKFVRGMQGINAHTVDLSLGAINNLFRMENMPLELLEMPADLGELKAEVRQLRLESASLREVPEWLGELRHLETLRLNGTSNVYYELLNSTLEELPASLGNLRALKSLRILKHWTPCWSE